MASVIDFLAGKKTYILSVLVIVYAVLSALDYVPKPDEVSSFLIVVSAFAVTIRSAISTFFKDSFLS